MPSAEQTAEFIKASFRSAWTMELMCFLMKNQERTHTHREMIDELRASNLIIRRSVATLTAAGLLIVDEDGAARYAPLNAELAEFAESAKALYATSPDAVRRIIVTAAHPSLTAFSDAFKFREDKE